MKYLLRASVVVVLVVVPSFAQTPVQIEAGGYGGDGGGEGEEGGGKQEELFAPFRNHVGRRRGICRGKFGHNSDCEAGLPVAVR